MFFSSNTSIVTSFSDVEKYCFMSVDKFIFVSLCNFWLQSYNFFLTYARIWAGKCKFICILCRKALLFAKKICTFDADFLFLLSRSPQKHRSERDNFLFRHRRDLVILHVLVYHLVELSQILRQLDSNFSLMCNFCTLKMYYLYFFGTCTVLVRVLHWVLLYI